MGARGEGQGPQEREQAKLKRPLGRALATGRLVMIISVLPPQTQAAP